MEKLKKIILQAVTTGLTACTGTTGVCYVIIPDTGVTYNLKIGLKQEAQDIGFFDASGTTALPPPPPPSPVPTVTTGFALPKVVGELNVKNNRVVLIGDSTIIQYGTVFSETVNSEHGLIVENVGSDVFQYINNGSLPNDSSWIDNLVKLKLNTLYYYRAFATNGDGTGYGVIKSETTLRG